ncbi:MAG: hypothetical protein B6U89_03355 [Desulfurococcales archaeon ex4484_58]|nr:MAG: hypothetical protein B6U89_03355 [Desulfurococcales archaeon ex4484_58]
MSLITLTILVGFTYSLLAIISIYIVSRRRFFQEAFSVLDKYTLPPKPRSKGELRRYKKLKSMISSARKRVFLLFILHLTIFTLTYLAMITSIGLFVGEGGIVYIPVVIPFITARENHAFYTHVYFIGFLAYITPLYFFIRAVRPATE